MRPKLLQVSIPTMGFCGSNQLTVYMKGNCGQWPIVDTK